jgi:hypothetical protein
MDTSSTISGNSGMISRRGCASQGIAREIGPGPNLREFRGQRRPDLYLREISGRGSGARCISGNSGASAERKLQSGANAISGNFAAVKMDIAPMYCGLDGPKRGFGIPREKWPRGALRVQMRDVLLSYMEHRARTIRVGEQKANIAISAARRESLT